MMATKPKTMRPEELATELNMSGKVLRSWLRTNHPRDAKAKNTAWNLSPAIVAEARKAFAPKPKADNKPKADAPKAEAKS
jgi:hypothetical protein